MTTDIHAAIAAVQDVPAVINAKRHMDDMNAARAKAEAAYNEAARLYREAGVLADAASDAFFDAVAEAQPSTGEGLFVVVCDHYEENRPAILAEPAGGIRTGCIYDTQDEAEAKAEEMQNYHDRPVAYAKPAIRYVAMTVHAARKRAAKSAYTTDCNETIDRGLKAHQGA